MEVYEIVKTIGGGNFGQVYLAKHKLEGKNYVLKKVKTRDMSARDRENTENEVRLLQKLRHTNIVGYKDSFLDREQFLNIVMVYCEGGDMYTKTKNAKGKYFTEDQVLEWFVQVLLALHYLHERRILHRDLKTQNIFLKNGKCIGTPYYMSPELFQNRPYSYKSDIWSLGCVLYEICNQRHAFDAQSINGLAMKILRGSYPPINAGYSKPLKDLIVKMLSVKPKERPNIVEIIQKPFIRKKVVEYLNECINMSQQPLDPTVVDDMYVEGLKEQAAQLGIVEVLNQSTSVPFPIIKKEEGKALGSTEKNKKQSGDASKKVEDKKKPVEKYKGLKAKLKEKQKMEENLAALKKERKRRLEEFKLKLKKNVKKHETPIKSREKINESIDKKSKPTESIKEEQDTKIGKPPVHNKKSIKTELEEKPYHRLNNAEFNKVFQRKMKHRNTSIEPKSKKAEASTSHSGHATGSSSEEPAIDQKEKILREKEQRKKEEREKIEKALQQIRFENYIARQKAKEKEAEMLRPSSGMKHSLSISNNREGKAQTKIEEQYGMEEEQQEGEEGEEELEDIQEEMEEHEYDKDEFKEELHSLKTMSIQMKTIKTQLKEQCEKIVQDLNGIVIPEEPEKPQKNEEENIEGILDYLAEDSQEEEEEEEVKEEPEAPEKHKLIERIGLLKQYKLPSNYKK